MMKFIFTSLIAVAITIGGFAMIWKGLSMSNDTLIILGVVIFLAGSGFLGYRFSGLD